MKKLLASLIAVVLIASTMSAAWASTGDTIVFRHVDTDSDYYEFNIEGATLIGRDVYYYGGSTLTVYHIDDRSEEKYTIESYDEPVEAASDESADEDENSESTWREVSVFFPYRDALYAVACYTTLSEDSQKVDGGYVYRVELGEDGTARLADTDIPQLDWSNMIESYGDENQYTKWVNSCGCSGDTLYLQTYTEDDTVVMAYDLTDGSVRELFIEFLNSFSPLTDSKILVTQFDYANPEQATVGLYDINDESFDTSADIRVIDYNIPGNLCYDEASDTLYYVNNGEIWAAQGFDTENAVSVNEAPISTNSQSQLTDDGYMLLWDWQTVLLKSVDPEKRSETGVNVMLYNTGSYLWDNAYYAYTNDHGDVAVAIKQSSDPDSILQAMMNRDDSFDIYCMSMKESAYDALYRRGYLMSMDANSSLTERINAMWPAFSGAVTQDGHIVAAPLSAYGYTVGYSKVALEKLGMKEEDLPKTWSEFIDLLDELPGLIGDNDEICAFGSYYTTKDVQFQLKVMILTDYQDYLNAHDEVEYAYNTPALNDLLNRLDEVDYDALGLQEPPEDEEEEQVWYSSGSDKTPLFDLSYQLLGMYNDSYYKSRPLILSVGDEEPTAGIDLVVAFVNPYSKHVDESLDFISYVLDSLPIDTKYALYPEYDQPLRNSGFEEHKKDVESWYEEAQKQYDEADEDEKESWEESLAWYKEQIENDYPDFWRFSADQIETYRGYVDKLAPTTYSFENELNGEESELYNVFLQY